jgi:hypothetical protein
MPAPSVISSDRNVGYDKAKDRAMERALTIWECIAFGAVALFAASIAYFFISTVIPSLKGGVRGGSPGIDYHPVGDLAGGITGIGAVDVLGLQPDSIFSTIL